MINMYILSIRIFIRILIGFIFYSTSISKLIQLRSFRGNIQDYQLIPAALESRLAASMVLAIAIPLAEILTGTGLIIGILLIQSVILALVLLAVFSCAVLINLLRGRRDLSCHCGGSLGDHPISWWLIGRNSLFLFGLLFLLVTPVDGVTVELLFHQQDIDFNAVLNILLPVLLLIGVVLALFLLGSRVRSLLHSTRL